MMTDHDDKWPPTTEEGDAAVALAETMGAVVFIAFALGVAVFS